MKNILITGASGFLGKNLSPLLEKDYKLIAVTRQKLLTTNSFFLDLASDFDTAIFNDTKIDGIIHLAAESNVNTCEQFPEKTYVINVLATKKLAEFAAQKSIPFVFASTDQVFDGEKGKYAPTDETKPINEYGKQKRAAEIAVLDSYAKAIICRLPLLLGENGGYEKTFVENIKAGKKQTLFTDEIRSAEEVEIVAKKLIKALEYKGGVYHFGGPKAMNRYEIGLMLAEKYDLNTALLQKGVQNDVKMLAARPKNVSMVENMCND